MSGLSAHFLQTLTDTPYSIHLSNFLLLLSLLSLFAGYAARRKRPQLNLPPAPAPSLPFIGHLLHLRPVPHISFHHLSRKYGPLIRLNLGFRFPTVVASSPETAAQILKTYDTHFCSRPSLASTDRYSYGSVDIAFSPYNPHWKQLRHFANAHLFNPGTVQSLSPVREQEVGAMVEFLSANSSSPVNLSDVLMFLFNNIMFREVFGRRPAAAGGGECAMKSRYHELIMEVGALMAEFCWGDMFPSLAWLDAVTGWRGRLERSFRAIDAVFEEEIAKRMNGRGGGDEEDCCFLDFLLRRRSDDRMDLQLSKTEVKAVLVVNHSFTSSYFFK